MKASLSLLALAYAALEVSALVTPSPTAHVESDRILIVDHPANAPPCASYHGKLTLQNSHLFKLPAGCSPAATVLSAQLFNLPAALNDDDSILVHAIPTALDLSIPELAYRAASLSAESFAVASGEALDQVVLGGGNNVERQAGVTKAVVISSFNDGSRLLAFRDLTTLTDFTSLPETAFTEFVAITSHALPLPEYHTTSSSPESALYPAPVPVPAADVARIAAHLKALRFKPFISSLLSSLPTKKIRTDVRYLTGEDQSSAKSAEFTWSSRHSMSTGGHKASNWIYQQLGKLGLDCQKHEFAFGFAPMVECVHPESGRNASAGTVVLGAHFDSRGSFGYPTAPGGDDDGSGTSLLLSVASHISKHPLTFDRKLIFAAFAGEEQGLLGSQWHAKHLKEIGEDVVLMIQVDMVGYRKPGEPLQLAFPPDELGLTEARHLVGNISSIYVPELVVGITPACCSDHQSFMSQGFASTWIFERNGPIADPCYHNSCDTSDRVGYDFEQIAAASRVILATVLEVAQLAFA